MATESYYIQYKQNLQASCHPKEFADEGELEERHKNAEYNVKWLTF